MAGPPPRDVLPLQIEAREASQVEEIVATGFGSLLGHVLGAAAGFGTVGRGLASIAGALVGHLAVTNRVVWVDPPPAPEGPESPAAHSDRR